MKKPKGDGVVIGIVADVPPYPAFTRQSKEVWTLTAHTVLAFDSVFLLGMDREPVYRNIGPVTMMAGDTLSIHGKPDK